MVTEEQVREFAQNLHRLQMDQRRLEDLAEANGQEDVANALERIRWGLESCFERVLEAHGRVILAGHLAQDLKAVPEL